MEKKFDPTQRRLQELRKKGQVPRGRVMSRAVSFMLGFAVMLLTVTARLESISDWSAGCLRGECGDSFIVMVDSGMIVVGPCATIIFITVLLDLWASNWLIGKEGEGISFSNMNLFEGVKGVWGRIRAVPFHLLSCSIFSVSLGAITWKVLAARFAVLTTVSGGVGGSIISEMYYLLAWGTGVGLSLGLLDYLRERFLFTRKNRMSLQELKDEYKQDEGDPQMKALRRGIYEEMMIANLEKRVKRSRFILIERNP